MYSPRDIKEEEVSSYIAFTSTFSVGYTEDFSYGRDEP